ncbi:MAG: hypothetical protein JNL82_36250 [Myxococcales bacterium]|nr:hypothetical protein [Myxococcales bacterium]
MLATARVSASVLLVCLTLPACGDAGGGESSSTLTTSGEPATTSGATGSEPPTGGEATSPGETGETDTSATSDSTTGSATTGEPTTGAGPDDTGSSAGDSSSGESAGESWLRSFGAPDSQRAGGLGFTAGGELWVAGDVYGALDAGLGPLAGDGSGIYLARYAGDGTPLHAEAMFASDGQPTLTTVTGLAVDATGAVIVTGWLEGSHQIGGQALVADEVDVFVGKWDAGGAPAWGRKFGEVDWQVGYAVAVGPGDEIWIAGAALAPFTAGDLVLTGTAGTGMYLLRLAADGTPEVGRWWGETGDQEARGVAVCADGSLALAGFITDPLTFGGEQVAASAGKDMFVARVDADGEPLWIRGLGGAGSDIASHVQCGDDLLFAGTVDGEASIGALALTPAGDAEAVIGRFSAAGALVWAAAATGPGDQVPAGLGLAAGGDVVVALTSTGAIDLGERALPGAGDRDVVLARYVAADASPTAAVALGDAARQVAGALALHPSGGGAVAMSHAGALTWDGLPAVAAAGPEDLALLRWAAGEL